MLRPLFSRHRVWLGELCRIAARLLDKACRAALPDARPAFIEFVQTFGDLVNFPPHVHGLAADGVFRTDGTFLPLPPLPETLLEGGFRRAVLDFLVGERAISQEFRERMLGWRYSGFSVHNRVRVAAEDAEGRKKLAGTMLRAPMSLEKMNYDAASGSVIYRSKMHLGLKRNFQVMAGAEWLELLCKHIPDRYEQLVRYCGWYSSRSRGARAARTAVSTNAASTVTEALSEYARAAPSPPGCRLTRGGRDERGTGGGVRVARALVDAVYDWSRFNSLPRGYAWIRRELENKRVTQAELVDATLRYGDVGTLRRMGVMLEREGLDARLLRKLEKKLPRSSGLIPWIPTQPKRGSISPRWGVVVNGEA